MDIIDKNNFFVENSNFEGRMSVFHDKLKKHLSNEYLFLSEKKDNLENEILQLKLEKNQKDKRLFSNAEKKDVRKYFSPLNLSEIDKEQQDGKEKQITEKIGRITEEAELLENRMKEIRDFLQDIEKMLHGRDSDDVESSDSLKKQEDEEKEDFFQKYDLKDSFLENIRNIEKYLQNKYNDFEILLEFEGKDIIFEKSIMKNIIMQLLYNIIFSVEEYNISVVLIEGNMDENHINLVLTYTCENMQINTVKITYDMDMK